MVTIEPGIYEHYKGNRYQVIGIARDTETDEDSVIYRPLYESEVAYWSRPYAMFMDTVSVNGVIAPRFKKIDSDGPQLVSP